MPAVHVVNHTLTRFVHVRQKKEAGSMSCASPFSGRAFTRAGVEALLQMLGEGQQRGDAACAAQSALPIPGSRLLYRLHDTQQGGRAPLS